MKKKTDKQILWVDPFLVSQKMSASRRMQCLEKLREFTLKTTPRQLLKKDLKRRLFSGG